MIRSPRTGRPFAKVARTQGAIVSVLDESPLPWNKAMLEAWIGRTLGNQLSCALGMRRIWRCAPGLFTSNRHYTTPAPQPIRITARDIELELA